MRKNAFCPIVLLPLVILLASCDDDENNVTPRDPDTAPRASIDRFSMDAGTLMIRNSTNGLPEANEPINFDSGEPFITMGLGPSGQMVEYYNFDVQPVDPAPIYVLQRENETSPVSGQLNIIDAIPGDDGYNDFWQVRIVTVPADYVANTFTGLAAIQQQGYDVQETDIIVNCPVVPEGSIASKRLGGESPDLTRGWYKDQVVFYFNFAEKELSATPDDMVPTSPIYVTFNINAGEPGGGPPSGFKTEMGTTQTHNVIATTPISSSYSPLWAVNIYDNVDFEEVMDLTSAEMAMALGAGPTVNCPVVSVQ